MTPVGHSLVGATIGAAMTVGEPNARRRVAVILAMVFCANVPDLPLSHWGHGRYDISHSLFVGVALVVCFTLLLRGFHFTRTTIGSWPLILTGALALFSHYALDSLYNHGKGVAVCWPFSDARIAFPIPWFTTMTSDPLLCWHNVRVWTIELFSFGAASVIALSIFVLFQRNRNDGSERD